MYIEPESHECERDRPLVEEFAREVSRASDLTELSIISKRLIEERRLVDSVFEKLAQSEELELERRLRSTPQYLACVRNRVQREIVDVEMRRRSLLVPGTVWHQTTQRGADRWWIVIERTEKRARLRSVTEAGGFGKRTESEDLLRWSQVLTPVDPESKMARRAVSQLTQLQLHGQDLETGLVYRGVVVP